MNKNKRSGIVARTAMLLTLSYTVALLCAATPISGLKLQGDANANGNSLTNAATISATNGYFNTVVATNGFTGNAATASYATNAGTAGYATNSGTATNVPLSGITGFGSGVSSLMSNAVTGTGSPVGSSGPIFNNTVIVGTNTPLSDANPNGEAYLGVGNSTIVPGVYIGLFCSHGTGLDGLSDGCYLGLSADGISWSISSSPVITPSTFGDTDANDPAIIRYNGLFYAAYTTGSNDAFRIVSSTNLTSWTSVAVVNLGLGSYPTGSPRWFVDTGNSALPYIICASGPSGTNQSIYGMQATTNTLTAWTAPTKLTTTNSNEDPFLIKIGSSYDLFYSSITDGYNIECSSASTPLGTYTVLQHGSNWTGLGTSREATWMIPLANGSYRLYASALSSGPYYYAQSASPTTTGSYSSALTCNIPFSSITNGVPILVNDEDSVRVAAFAALSLGLNSVNPTLAATSFTSASSAGYVFNSNGQPNNAFTFISNDPTSYANIVLSYDSAVATSGHITSFTGGFSGTTNNSFSWIFDYVGSGSASNQFQLCPFGYGTPIIAATASYHVLIGTATDDGTDALQVTGSTKATVFNSNATQTTTNGSTAGTVTCSMPFAGSSYKKVLFTLTGFNGTATYTAPGNFTSTNVSIGPTLSGIVTMTGTNSFSISTSTNTTVTGDIEGY